MVIFIFIYLGVCLCLQYFETLNGNRIQGRLKKVSKYGTQFQSTNMLSRSQYFETLQSTEFQMNYDLIDFALCHVKLKFLLHT